MTTYTPNFTLPKPEASETPDGPSQIGGLADRLDTVLAAFDANVTIGASNGTTTNAVIPDGNTWNDVEDPVSITVTQPGLIVVFGSVYLKHEVSSGDPQAQVELTGPVSGLVSSFAQVGSGTVGGIQAQASVPVLAKATITAAGTVTLQRQVRHHISSGEDHEWGYFDLYWIVIGQADA